MLFTYYAYLAHFKLWKHCVLSLVFQSIFQITVVYLTFRKCFWLDSGFFFNCFHWLSAQRTKYVAESLLRETEQYWERATLDCQCWQNLIEQSFTYSAPMYFSCHLPLCYSIAERNFEIISKHEGTNMQRRKKDPAQNIVEIIKSTFFIIWKILMSEILRLEGTS